MVGTLSVSLHETLPLLSHLLYQLTGAFQNTLSQVWLARFLVGLPGFGEVFGEA